MSSMKEIVGKRKSLDLMSLKKSIYMKQQNIEKLQKEYNSLTGKENLHCDRNPKDMKSSLLMLKAQIEVLNSSIPISVPNCQPLLFAYVHYSLRKEVDNLDDLIAFQKQMLHISLKKSKELKQLCEREQIDYESTDVSSYQQMLIEKEKTRSKIMECLHRKLARRIRRITRQFYPAMHTEEEKYKNGAYPFVEEKSMFFILEKLLTELSGSSSKSSFSSNEWEKPGFIRIDESFPRNYIQLLLDHQIVEFSADPFCLKLASL